jgi:cyclopropane fatty-acyl-phospholipid synthase-like methyltransferase
MKNTVNLLDIVNEAERFSPQANMLSAFRLLQIGNYLELKGGQTVIDCGCGRGEALCLWAKYFGTIGLGVDVHGPSIADATSLAKHEGVSDKVQFVQADMRAYDLEQKRFDVAACLGATMCFGGFEPAVRTLKQIIARGGQIVIGEAFFTTHDVPDELKEYEGDEPTETELFDMVRAAGCEVGYYSRASRAEWERYIFHTHKDEIKALLSMPSGPERERARSHRWQDIYLRYRQKWQGMAFMTVHPV